MLWARRIETGDKGKHEGPSLVEMLIIADARLLLEPRRFGSTLLLELLGQLSHFFATIGHHLFEGGQLRLL